MDYTVLTFKKIQFLDSWTQSFSADQNVTDYKPSSGTSRMRVVTDWPGLGVHTYDFTIAWPNPVLVSAQENLVQIPGLCTASAKGDTTSCPKK